MTDAELLEQHRQGSPSAAAELVRRHIDWVYCVARRRTGCAHLAEDVTQATFIVLTRKPPRLVGKASLSSWLFGVVNRAAMQALRNESRRRRRETGAALMRSEIDSSSEKPWDQIEPLLDQMVQKLGKIDRQAVLLRFYENKSYAEVGESLGVSEEAARKRVTRAIEQLRGNFAMQSGAGLEALLAAKTLQSAPPALKQSIVLIMGHSNVASLPAAQLARQIIARASAIKLSAIAVAMTILIGGAIWFGLDSNFSQKVQAQAQTDAPILPGVPISAMTDDLKNFPMQKGWPLALPGKIVGSPMPADLEGNGKLDIVVPCMAVQSTAQGPREIPLVHPLPDMTAQLYAFHADGTPVKGWPVQIMSADDHVKSQPTFPGHSEDWSSTPAVFKLNGRDVVAMTSPNGPTRTLRRVFIINGDGTSKILSTAAARPDPWATVAVDSVNNDGVMDVLAGRCFATVDGKAMTGWGGINARVGFSVCVGDARGDGQKEIFLGGVRNPTSPSGNGEVFGYDHAGNTLKGWPQKIGRQIVSPPVMGDLLGDGKKEIVVADQKQRILAWTFDGQRFGSTFAEDTTAGNVTPAEACTSIFKEHIASYSPISLADLDGDGKPEIVVLDDGDSTVRAWHGDGRGVGNEDGIIANLPSKTADGVSIADLDADGVMDLFVGRYWIKLAKDGKSEIVNMLPDDPDLYCQDTICDLDGDGKAEILLGAGDGRVFVYRTEKAYRPDLVQWATIGGNPRHTGCWTKPTR